jgi:hypothetical protein
MIIAPRLLQAFAEIEACGYSCTIVDAFFMMSGDEGRTRPKVFVSEADLLKRDAEYVAQQRAKLSVVK